MLSIEVKSYFQAAVALTNYAGPCSQLHGHTYHLQAIICNEDETADMVADYYQAKEWVDTAIKPLNYAHLNTLDAFKTTSPTSENIAKWIYAQLKQLIPNHLRITRIRLAENDVFAVIYEPTET